MNTATAAAPTRLEAVFRRAPRDGIPAPVLETLSRYVVDLDCLGRVDASGRPLVDEHTLFALLARQLPQASAGDLLARLADLPGAALRERAERGPAPAEVGWYALAERVPIYDPSPTAALVEVLASPAGPAAAGEVAARVNVVFPSMEIELLAPALAAKLMSLATAADRSGIDHLLRALTRQLGWWAALTAVILVPVAAAAAIPDQEVVWPLAMFAVAAGIGGWTLTVVGGNALAPVG